MNTADTASKVAFIDRDGVLIFEPPDTRQIDSLEKLQILPGVLEGLARLIRDGYRLVMVTNQDGLGTPSFPKKDFELVQNALIARLKEGGVLFDEIFICPHFAADNCGCRKPKTGLLDEFQKTQNIDYEKSFLIGDRETDAQLAKNIGVRMYWAETNGAFPRIASGQRTTSETRIFVQCNIDGRGNFSINTGLNFLNHVLEQFSKHSLIDLVIRAEGDLHIDEHHTVEDVGLVLGSVLTEALGQRKGINRYGFLLPMDDTLVEVAVDLGGRPYLVFNCEFVREKVGDVPTELIEHFFKSVADTLKANIHINVRYSKNEHHKIEAMFKAFAKSMKIAVAADPRLKGMLPSTKGTL